MTSLLEFVAAVLRLHEHRFFEDMANLGRADEAKDLREALTDVEDVAVDLLRRELQLVRVSFRFPPPGDEP